ncbi:MAG: carbohydrate ABC transporter permease [Candidatus Methylomirabilia bacterium]
MVVKTVGSAVAPLPAAFPRQGRLWTARRRDIWLAYLFLSPTLLLLLGALAYPVAWEVGISLTDFSPLKDSPTAFIGLENYRRLLATTEFWHAATATVVYIVVTTVAKLILGVGFALLLARPFFGRPLVFLAIFLPWAYPASVSVIGWYWTLSPPITTSYSIFMSNLKFAVDSALGNGAWGLLSVLLFNIWRGSSFIGVFLLAGINAIPPELFECALLESKSAWRRFRLVTVPLLKPFLALAVFLSLTTAFADLANVWMLTAGRIVYPILGTRSYWLAIHGGQFGPAAALSLTVVPLLIAALFVLFRMFDPPEKETA